LLIEPLSTIVRAVLKKNIKLWKEYLPHVEFAYNRSMHSTTKMCPFEIVYGLIARAPIDLMPLPTSEKLNFDAKQRAELMLKLHEITKENIERMNSKYKLAGNKGRKQLIFEPGELVWLHLRKDRFPALRKSKLMPRADGPFKVLEQINDNAYKLDLPVDFGVSPTFNIADLKPYLEEDDELELRMTQMQEGEDDEDITTNNTSTPTPVSTSTTPLGPITRAHARRLTHQVSSLLSSGSSYLYNGDTCALVLLRNNGLDQKGSRRLDSDCRTNTNCDGRHDFIQTPFWTFKYFLESLSNLLSKGSGITSISIRSQLQSSI
jgi:hypothetical protein